MAFQPVIGQGGLPGWRLLERTLDRQMTAHAANPASLRDEAYFRERATMLRAPDDLVSDRRLLRIALTAFGLADDLNNRVFIRRVLESDLGDRRSLANRLADKRYLEFASAFRFKDPEGPATQRAGFADGLLQRFRDLRFEEAVGSQNDSMRLALALRRDLQRIATQPVSEDARWFSVLGSRTLRVVFEQAFGLPREFATLDLDRQVTILRARVRGLTGSSEIAQFAEAGRIDRLVTRFLTMAQVSQMRQNSATSIALGILQSAPRPGPAGFGRS